MNVSLTTRQLERVRAIVPDGPLADWLVRGATQTSDRKFGVWMPAIGWRKIEELMFNFCYDDRGYRGKRVRESDLRALKAMRQAINLREHHPALSKMGAVGMINELIPAWRCSFPSDTDYSPYPQMGCSFVILIPEYRNSFTYWVEGNRPSEMPLLNEAEHWALA